MEQAVESLDGGREAEDFQAVGVRLREAMVTYAGEVADDALVPEGGAAPKAADVVGWTNLVIADQAEGPSSKQFRSYATKLTRETGLRQLADSRQERDRPRRAHRSRGGEPLPSDDHRNVLARSNRRQEPVRDLWLLPVVAGACMRCGWHDPDYVAPPSRQLTEKELAARLEQPCVPSSDNSTFRSPDDYR